MSDIVKQTFDLAAPAQAMEVAKILQQFVKEKKLTANIKGKEYPLVEAWLFAGSQLGLYPLLSEVKDLTTGQEIKYQACVEIRRINNDQIVSRGYAVCSNKEASKKQFDEYAILSMAQTRAEGKAFRMILAWLMKAAGFEATPAEEMDFKNDGLEDKIRTKSYNRVELEKNGFPLITNAQFKKASERIMAGELDVYYKVLAEFSLEPAQATSLKQTYDESKKIKQ